MYHDHGQLMLSKIKQLKNNHSFMKYFQNISWLFVEKIIRIGISFFIGIWVARYLGAEQFGLYSYAQSFVGLFAAIATLGLDQIIIRELVKDETQRDVLLGTAFALKLFGAFLVLFVLAIAVKFTSNDFDTNLLIFIIASSTIFQSFNVIDFYFQSKVLSKYVVFVNIASFIISSFIKIILILNEAPIIAFVYIILFDSIIVSFGYLYIYLHKNLNIKSWKFSKTKAKQLLKTSWPLIPASIAISIYLKIDQVMIKEILDNEAVGQYAVAVKLSELWTLIPAILIPTLFPAIIKAKKESDHLYYRRLQQLYDVMIWLAVMIAIPVSFFSYSIVDILFGEQYTEAGSVLSIHVWANIFIFLGTANAKWFIVENYTKKLLFRTALGAVLNIVGNLILIPMYGIQGAAFATLLSQASSNLFYDIFDKDVRISLKQKLNALFFVSAFRRIKKNFNLRDWYN